MLQGDGTLVHQGGRIEGGRNVSAEEEQQREMNAIASLIADVVKTQITPEARKKARDNKYFPYKISYSSSVELGQTLNVSEWTHGRASVCEASASQPNQMHVHTTLDFEEFDDKLKAQAIVDMKGTAIVASYSFVEFPNGIGYPPKTGSVESARTRLEQSGIISPTPETTNSSS